MEADSRIDLQGQLKVVRKVERVLAEAGVIKPYQGRYNKNVVPEKVVFWVCELKEPVLKDEVILPGQDGDWLANLEKEKEKQDLAQQIATLGKASDDSNQKLLDSNQSEAGKPVATEEARLDRDSDL